MTESRLRKTWYPASVLLAASIFCAAPLVAAAESAPPIYMDTTAPASAPPSHSHSQPVAAPVQGGLTHEAPKWQAEEWVINRTSTGLLPGQTPPEKEQHKGPVRHFVKSVAKGTAKELGTSLHRMGQDMVFVFSVQDIDPYDKSAPPTNKPAIVLQFNLVDGTTCYLRHFPDGSYAIEDGFADGTVMLPDSPKGTYLVKYPNGGKGKMVCKPDGSMEVHRPDNTITTFSKTAAGGFRATNSAIGYMGEARPDSTGIHYELGDW